MKILNRILLGSLLILIGVLEVLFSIFALGPLPANSGMSDIYWLIFTGGSNVFVGIVYFFALKKNIVLALSSLLIIINLIPTVQQILSGNYFLFPLILLGIILNAIPTIVYNIHFNQPLKKP